VKHLPASVEMSGLKELFAHCGKIASIKVATDETGKSRGYAYITFESEEACQKAFNEMNGSEVDGQAIVVERYNAHHRAEMSEKFSNLYVKNVNKTLTDEEFKAAFEKFGEVTSLALRKDPATGQCQGYGYVAFKDHASAQKALDELNGKSVEKLSTEGESLVVRRFESKKERARRREIQWRERQAQYAKYPNLYVKNLEDHVNTDQLRAVFEAHGPTESVRVMVDRETKISRGFGFVSYRDHASAQKAIQALAGSTILGSRPLYVTYAMKRDARRQQFEDFQKKRQQRTMQMGAYPPAMGYGGGPQMPPFGGPMGGPMGSMGGGMGGQMHGGMPGQMQGRSGGVPPHMMMPRNQPNFGGQPGMPMGAQMAMPQRIPARQQAPPKAMMYPPSQPQPAASPSLSTLLANMSVEQQKNVLGERLYAHISRAHSSEAAKITGMLLEMDNAEILHLLEAPAQLDEKVNEALEVLRQHANY
jgi:polyadenylate-binding protein